MHRFVPEYGLWGPHVEKCGKYKIISTNLRTVLLQHCALHAICHLKNERIKLRLSRERQTFTHLETLTNQHPEKKHHSPCNIRMTSNTAFGPECELYRKSLILFHRIMRTPVQAGLPNHSNRWVGRIVCSQGQRTINLWISMGAAAKRSHLIINIEPNTHSIKHFISWNGRPKSICVNPPKITEQCPRAEQCPNN